MADDPYRPPPPQSREEDAALARLAAKGQRRILDASGSSTAVSTSAEDRNLRVALGGYGGSPIRVAALVFMAAGLTLMIGDFLWAPSTLVSGFLLLVAASLVRVFAPPMASRASVAAEKAWTTSLPFALDGYFQVLAAAPEPHCQLTIVLAWTDPRLAARADTVQGVLGVVDPRARIETEANANVTIRSGPIACNAGIIVNGGYVYRNTRIVAYVHDLVSGALLPLHRSHAIASVSLSRG